MKTHIELFVERATQSLMPSEQRQLSKWIKAQIKEVSRSEYVSPMQQVSPNTFTMHVDMSLVFDKVLEKAKAHSIYSTFVG